MTSFSTALENQQAFEAALINYPTSDLIALMQVVERQEQAARLQLLDATMRASEINNTLARRATRVEELAALKVLEATMFEAQDAWVAVNNKDNTPEQAAWRVAFKAFHAARSAWINS